MLPLSQRTILMVEDNDDDFEATRRCFEFAKIRNPIEWCKGGQDALDYLRGEGAYTAPPTHMPVIALLDLNMPGIDGRQTLALLKKDGRLRKLPVIILSTSADEGDVDMCYELGASSYIQKPIDLEGLQNCVTRIRDYWLGTALLPKFAPAQR